MRASCVGFRSKALLLAGFALLALPAPGQRGALTLPRNLAELTQQAQTIVHGRVMLAHVEPHPQLTNLSTVVVTLRVEETLKGQAAQFFTFRQFIWDARDRLDAAGYRKGQELLLLLNPPTPYGLVSPTGIEQGRFRILRDTQGRKTAINGYGNAGLFDRIAVQAKSRQLKFSASTAALMHNSSPGKVPLDQIEEVIRQFAGAK
jgi:hypothetical protein